MAAHSSASTVWTQARKGDSLRPLLLHVELLKMVSNTYSVPEEGVYALASDRDLDQSQAAS